MKRTGYQRFVLCFLTFIPPFAIASMDPSIFIQALGVAGGFGEAFLNGILPAWLVWEGRYKKKLASDYVLIGGKTTLTLIFVIAFFVMILEFLFLLNR